MKYDTRKEQSREAALEEEMEQENKEIGKREESSVRRLLYGKEVRKEGKEARYHRIAECLMQDAECLFVCLHQETKEGYPRERLRCMWETILANQFLDCVPGNSVWEAYEEVLELELDLTSEALIALSSCKEEQEAALVTDREFLTVFNTTPFDREDSLESEGHLKIYADGKALPVQWTEYGTTVWKPERVFSHGFRVFESVETEEEESVGSITLELETMVLETPFYRVKFQEGMEFVSLYDKEAGKELIAPNTVGNAFLTGNRADLDEKCSILQAELVEQGAIRTVLRVVKQIADLVICQDIIFYEYSRKIDFVTHISQGASDVSLQAAFPWNLTAMQTVSDLCLANAKSQEQETDWTLERTKVKMRQWADFTEEGYGIAIFTDSKYACEVKDNTVFVNLLQLEEVEEIEEEQEITYAFFPHLGDFRKADVVKEGYFFHNSAYQITGQLPVRELQKSYVTVSEENVVLETMKLAEDSDEVILRFYEAYGKQTKAKVVVYGFHGTVYETDLLEQKLEKVSEGESDFTFTIEPHEVRTFCLVSK